MEQGMRALFVIACAGLFACSAATTSGDEPAPVVTPHDFTPVDPGTPVAHGHDRAQGSDAFGLGLPSNAPTAFVCSKGAFCDDFEVPKHDIGTRWSGITRTGAGKWEADSESASLGKGALTLYAQDADSTVFLDQSSNVVADTWSGLMGFAFKVAAAPGRQVGGPEIVLKTRDGLVSVRVSLYAYGLVLEQLATDACTKDRCKPTSTVIAPVKEGAWYRVRIGFDVSAQNAPPYGRLEASVDGGPLQSTALNVPLYDGALSLHAGITQGDARWATVNLDDVTLLVP
jgi:hypothetical protein